ncbi:MAG: DEAD/DEAH box helicase family protein, partial [Crocosphaera sp.]
MQVLNPSASTPKPLQLRPYQRNIVEAVDNSNSPRQLIIAGTGTGKTFMAANVIKRALVKGKKTLFFTHRNTLLTQAADEFAQIDLPVNFISSGSRVDLSEPVHVVSLQTLAYWSSSELEKLPKIFDQVIFDECHITNWFTIAQFFCPPLPETPPFKVIGLTATPWRRSKYESLADYYQTSHVAPLPSVLMAQGFLCPFVYFTINKISRNNLKIEKNGEYEKLGQKAQVNTPEYIDKVIAEWVRLAKGRPTIVFAVDIEHAHAIADRFTQAGIPAAAVDGTMSLKERRKKYQQLELEEILILVSCEALSEGFNVKKVAAIVLFRLTTSRSKYYQQIGRGARLWPSKINCVVLDAVGLIDGEDFGFLEDLTEEDFAIFESEERPSKTYSPKKNCDNCSAMVPASLRICSNCHYEFPLAEKEVSKSVFSSMGLTLPKSQREKITFYHDLLRQAFKQQKSFNWCDRTYKMRYGQHPQPQWRKGAIFGDNPTSEQKLAYQQYLKAIATQCNL